MLRIGVTGGIATGKSTAAAYLAQKFGANLIDADQVVHHLYAKDQALLAAVGKEFPEVLHAGSIDRKALGTMVFGNELKLQKLAAIVHPRVRAEMLKQVQALPAGTARVLMVVPLLFEAGLEKDVDRILVILADPQVQITRLAGRGLDRQAALARLRAQWPNAKRQQVKAAQFVWNNGDLATFHDALDQAWGKLNEHCPSVV